MDLSIRNWLTVLKPRAFKGLALIYRKTNPETKVVKVEYLPSICSNISCPCHGEYNKEVRSKNIKVSCGLSTRLLQWLKGDFSDVSDFTQKSSSWGHQKEYRIFAQPGIEEMEKYRVELKAILYTIRFDKETLKTLDLINKQTYNSELKIGMLRPSYTKYYPFIVFQNDKDKEVDAPEWIDKLNS